MASTDITAVEPEQVVIDDVQPEPAKTSRSKRRSGAGHEPKPVEPAEPAMVLVDLRGPVGANPAMMSALAIKTAGAALTLTPGLTPVPKAMWDSAAAHAGIARRIEDGEIEVLPEIPRRMEPRRHLISRTFSAAGLDAIEADERDRYGDKPRGIIVDDLAKQRAKIARRTPIGPGKLVKFYKVGTNTVDIMVDLVNACGLTVDRVKVESALHGAMRERGLPTSALIQHGPYNASNAPAQDQIRAMLKALKLRWSVQDGEFLVFTQ